VIVLEKHKFAEECVCLFTAVLVFFFGSGYSLMLQRTDKILARFLLLLPYSTTIRETHLCGV
jgi:hypothetical protein